MKALLNTLIILLVSCSASAQTDGKITLGEKMLVGEIKNGQPVSLVDAKAMIAEANRQLYKGKEVLNTFEIHAGTTQGDKQVKFYYMHFSSGTENINMVRWLTNDNGKLYIENANEEDFTIQDYYVACTGEEFCFPRMFYTNAEYAWGCREELMCVTPEEAEKNKCMQSTIIMD